MLKRKPGLNTLKLLVQEEGQVQDVLGPIEEKLLGLMSQTVISGCPEVVEAGFGSFGWFLLQNWIFPICLAPSISMRRSLHWGWTLTY
ncbi:unnamed protein product [Tenebrio molitor]|nr:unnamed protein product [Tenebrio molitor]